MAVLKLSSSSEDIFEMACFLLEVGKLVMGKNTSFSR